VNGVTPEQANAAGWNWRYLAYCQGDAPGVVLERDRARWPGGVMAGFITWAGPLWREWLALTGKDPTFLSTEDHAAFDEWLAERFPVRALPTEAP